MHETFFIDPDIRLAETLSSAFYTDEKYFSLSRDKIFARTWQIAGFDHDIGGDVSVYPARLLGGFCRKTF